MPPLLIFKGLQKPKKVICREISRCRLCGNDNLVKVIDLGTMALTGIFPETKKAKINSGPLEVVKCTARNGDFSCGLVQLKHSYNPGVVYGDNYGYRSSLNKSMVLHLKEIVDELLKFINLNKNDLVLDIGSNDGTMLGFYPKTKQIHLVGIDPTAAKFREYYPEDVQVIPRLFSSEVIKEFFGERKFKVITTIAMFYDLDNPLKFTQEVAGILDDNGVWVMEQSYLPSMLRVNAYDTICHEHLEYYALKQIYWLVKQANLKIIDLSLNNTNGGSIKLTLAKQNHKKDECTKRIQQLLRLEEEEKINSPDTYIKFRGGIERHKDKLIELIEKINAQGKTIYGYGASTKGNVILQHCNLSSLQIPMIAEVNQDKFNHFTPLTDIPITDEKEARRDNPDYFLVLPWHFKESIIAKEAEFLKKGGHLIFPLPEIEVI